MTAGGLPPARDQRTVDIKHVELLALFHFIGAFFALLAIGGVLVHYAFFNSIMKDPAVWARNPQGPPPQALFEGLKWLYLACGGWFGTSLVLNVLAGFCLLRRKARTFCFVVAAFDCLHTPLGTVLGIFTIIVLARDSVRDLFQQRAYGLE